MKRDYLNNYYTKDKKEFISVGLLGASAVMVVLMVIKVTAFLAAPVRAEQAVKTAAALSKLDDEEVKKCIANSEKTADELKKKNLFVPPPQKKHPVSLVLGILGDEAFINGKWYKTGDNVGDAKIVALEPTQVRIEWEGNEKTFIPIDAKGASPSGPQRPTGPVATSGGTGRPEMVVVRPDERPMPDRGDGDLSPEERARRGGFEGMRERFRNMSEEERREAIGQMRARFENMSPEEREQARAEMRERFGGRGPRSEGGPGGRGGSSGRRGGRGGRD